MRKNFKNALKVIGINLLIAFVLVNVIYWSIPTVAAISDLFSTIRPNRASAAISPSYSAVDADWLPAYQREKRRTKTVYRSFVGWRTDAFAGEAINIEGPYLQRRTTNSAAPGAKSAYFFGGSTMWGSGSNDAGTIPSQFAAIAGFRAENFGESGWVAQQSLAMLMQLIQEGHRPDLVVFYDGINEVYVKCVEGFRFGSHRMEARIGAVLRQNVNPASFTAFLAPALEVRDHLTSRLTRAVSENPDYHRDCDANPKKAERIADGLLRDWDVAGKLVKSYGGKFVAFLQPVLMFSRTPYDHLRGRSFRREFNGLRPQYEAVYPLLRQKVASSGEFHDLIQVLDGDEVVHVDILHISPRGNRRVAKKISETVTSLGLSPR
ncbi:MAG: hypothetical protein GEU95_01800 [Rhizobiales bacterium]|nr:hypothetical protein [Hyphomicrobiales bacterium]